MDTHNIHTLLDTLSALRSEAADLPAAKLAAILHQLDPETAARVQAIVAEFDDREAQLQDEIAEQEAAIKQTVLATGATAQGTALQALIIAPRITWDNKGRATYAALHPDVLAYQRVGEPSVQIRARSTKRP
jgi:hypothetical protein